jgi:hypothetical protein
VVRFARLIHRPVRVLGGPAARAASGGNLSLPLVATHGGRAPAVIPLEVNAIVVQVELAQLGAGGDAELGVDLVQVVADRVPADNQLVGELLVGQPWLAGG